MGLGAADDAEPMDLLDQGHARAMAAAAARLPGSRAAANQDEDAADEGFEGGAPSCLLAASGRQRCTQHPACMCTLCRRLWVKVLQFSTLLCTSC